MIMSRDEMKQLMTLKKFVVDVRILKFVQKVLRVFLGLLTTSSIFHPISIIFWQIKDIAEHFMLSVKCFGKMK